MAPNNKQAMEDDDAAPSFPLIAILALVALVALALISIFYCQAPGCVGKACPREPVRLWW
jgi:hypothetical protein